MTYDDDGFDDLIIYGKTLQKKLHPSVTSFNFKEITNEVFIFSLEIMTIYLSRIFMNAIEYPLRHFECNTYYIYDCVVKRLLPKMR